MPKGDLEAFLKQYDLIHIHKQLDKECKIMDMIKFLGIPVIIDIDDHFLLGDDHPMSITAKKERWHEPIINHLKKADYVTTTTPIFANVLKKYNKNVAVFPNAIDPKEEQFDSQAGGASVEYLEHLIEQYPSWDIIGKQEGQNLKVSNSDVFIDINTTENIKKWYK